MCEVAPIAVIVAVPIADSAFDGSIQVDLRAECVEHGMPVDARHG